MTRKMYDALSTEMDSVPSDVQLFAGYIDAGQVPAAPPMTDADWAKLPAGVVQVRIATQPGTNDGHVLDVENGDASPSDAPGWVTMRRNAGLSQASVYCSEAVWDTVKQQFTDQQVAMPEWWIAGYPGSAGEGNLYPGAVAHQYADAGAYDVSVVEDHWPGVDPEGDWFDMATKAELAEVVNQIADERLGPWLQQQSAAVEKYVHDLMGPWLQNVEAQIIAAIMAAKTTP